MLGARLVGSSMKAGVEGGQELDIASLLRRLVLFDSYVLVSHRLREFGALATHWGIEPVIDLLEADAIRIVCDVHTIAQTGQATVLQSREAKGALPLGAFSFSAVTVPNHAEYLDRCLSDSIDHLQGHHKLRAKLKRVLGTRARMAPPRLSADGVDQLKSYLRDNHPTLRKAVASCAAQMCARDIELEELLLRVHPIDEDDFRTESNLGIILDLDDRTAHAVIERAFLAVGGLNIKIGMMSEYSALSGFQDDEAWVFEQRLQHVASLISADLIEQRFDQVVRVLEAPSFDDIPHKRQIDVSRLLELRESTEIRAFRDWLTRPEELDEHEIKSVMDGVRGRCAGIYQSTAGKAIRFIATTASGFVPVAGMPLSIGLGAMDSFILDRVIKRSPVAAFLGSLYPSIFRTGT